MPEKPLPKMAMRGAAVGADAADEAGVTAVSGKEGPRVIDVHGMLLAVNG